MIKIEFKEAITVMNSCDNNIVQTKFLFNYPCRGRLRRQVKSVNFGCPSELVPSRAEVLKQLGISKEQDEELQLKYSKL